MGFDAEVPPGLWERIQQIVDTSVAKLLKSGLLQNASISNGGLTIKGGFFKLKAPGAVDDTFYAGPGYPAAPDGNPQPVMVWRRNDGTKVFSLADGSPLTDGYFQHFDFFDRSGNPIFSEDATSGQGLGRPYLPIPLYPRDTVGSAGRVATMSGSFTTLWAGEVPKQQPKLFASIILGAPVDATAEARLVVNGAQVGDVVSVAGGAAGAAAYKLFPATAIPGAHMATTLIEIQGRVSAGIGAISVAAHRMEGRQS